MDSRKKLLLKKHHKDIVRDLDINYIIDDLLSKEAISSEDFDHIFELNNSRVQRTRYLIDSLIQNGTDHSYEVFVDSLQKDYSWLWKKLALDEMPASVNNESFEDSLSRGDVPRLPEHYVQRVKLEDEVASKLRTLTRHKILVLHGMSGSGKTSVAIGVLRNNPDLITSDFNGVVFWLNLGNVKTEDDIVLHQNMLHRKTSSMYMHRDSVFMNSSVSMSSIGSNADSHSITTSDWTWQELRDMLKSQFLEPALKESLLVLDEVNEKKCLEAFDVGCKILVTTRDTDVVANFQPQILKIKNNLEEKESLELFASCLDIDVTLLPRQAKKLHEICKGSPFHIALIGAQLAENKERLIHDNSHWNYYINKLYKKEFYFFRPHDTNPMKTIEVCINSLKPNILSLFKMLVILPDNVKVSTMVLGKLWHKQTQEVESIMKQLKSKSLIMETYNQEQRNYNYEVHDLIMNYLRSVGDDLSKLHSDFLESYNYGSLTNCPLELVDDGYIPFYIGHHIHHTNNLNGKWGLFKLYLNLKFLGNKVRLTGAADAIMDLQKYEALITDTDLDRELLFHVKSFLGTHGNDLYRYPSTDIVQSILQHEAKGILAVKAHQLALENCANNELYFDLLHEQNVEEVKHTTIDVNENITAVCFLGDMLVVGTEDGTIKMFDIWSNELKRSLTPGSTVRALEPSPRGALAVRGEGPLTLYHDDVSDDLIEEETEEMVYNDNYSSAITINPKLGPFLNCKWANKEETLITHTSKMIIIYSTDGKVLQLIDNFERDKEIISCVPSNDDKYLIVATNVGQNYYMEVWNLRTKERIMYFEETVSVKDIIVVPNSNRVLIFNDSEIMDHEFKINAYAQNKCNTYSCKKIITSNEIKENLQFITAVVNRSGSLLFVSTNDSRVVCIDLKTNTYVFHLDNRRGNVSSICASELWWEELLSGVDALGTGTDCERLAKVWTLGAAYVAHTTQQHRKVRLTTKFDVSFLHSISPYTPSGTATPPDINQPHSIPKRHQSFAGHKEIDKRMAKKTVSLDRHSLKPLNLKGISNGNEDIAMQPLLAVVDDKNNIQIIRGRKVLSEITNKSDDKITTVKISPCNQYVIFGLESGCVKKYILRLRESKIIMDIYSPVQYLKFVNQNLLVVAGKNRCLMAYRLMFDGGWKLEMLQKGNMNLGSQEILNDITGTKKKNGQPESLSRSASDISITSKERLFPNNCESKNRLCKGSSLVECFWLNGIGMITVENNASIKLWNEDIKLVGVLNGRQTDVYVSCAALQKNILVICDEYGKFQIFEIRHGENDNIYLRSTTENKLNHRIVSCDVTSDGHILAMGLDSGDVVIWNIPAKSQVHFLRHHKSKVQWCSFSFVPNKLYRSGSTAQSPTVTPQTFTYSNSAGDLDDQPPLVLVTMASEIVWWNVTYLMRMRAKKRKPISLLSPIASPLIENRTDLTAAIDNLTLNKPKSFFFGGSDVTAYDSWEAMWKNKTCKKGSKRKEILACIKLSGMNAKSICHDDKFSCFVTVDNSGHIHIMNLMGAPAS